MRLKEQTPGKVSNEIAAELLSPGVRVEGGSVSDVDKIRIDSSRSRRVSPRCG